MKLWIGNVAADVTGDELRDLLHRYGAPAFDAMLQVPGDGSRPGVLLTFEATNAELLHHVAHRLNGLYWKQKGITAHVMQH